MLQLITSYYIITIVISALVIAVPFFAKIFMWVLIIEDSFTPLAWIHNIVESIFVLGVFITFFQYGWWVPFVAVPMYSLVRFAAGIKTLKMLGEELGLNERE